MARTPPDPADRVSDAAIASIPRPRRCARSTIRFSAGSTGAARPFRSPAAARRAATAARARGPVSILKDRERVLFAARPLDREIRAAQQLIGPRLRPGAEREPDGGADVDGCASTTPARPARPAAKPHGCSAAASGRRVNAANSSAASRATAKSTDGRAANRAAIVMNTSSPTDSQCSLMRRNLRRLISATQPARALSPD